MKHKVKNGNKLCTKLFTMLLACSLLLAGIPSAVMAEEEEPANLIGTKYTVFDPTFEKYPAEITEETDEAIKAEIETLQEFNAVLDANGGRGENDETDPEGQSLKLPLVGNQIKFEVPVEPATNYTFSFWMKNSKADALEMAHSTTAYTNYFHTTGPKDRYIGHKDLNSYFDWNDPYFARIFNDMTFGSEHTVTADMNKWRQVSINFTSPYEGEGLKAVLAFACAKDDPYLAVDDLELVATKNDTPNRILNGDVEALRYDKGTASASDFVLYKDIELAQSEDRTYCFKTTSDSGGTAITSLPLFFFKGKNLGTRYKISMKYKPIDEKYTNNKAYFRLQGSSSAVDTAQLYNFGLLASSGWNTYTMYVDATKAEAAGTPFAARNIWFNATGEAYIDDFYSGRDESNIDFYKELVLQEETDNDPYFHLYTGKGGANIEAEDVLMFERSIEAKSISDITPDANGNRTVKTRLHYLPEPIWGHDESGNTTVAFTKTEVTLLTAVYKYENGRKILYNIDVASGIANDKTIDVVGEVSVPTAVDGEHYEVEAMALNMNNLKTILNKEKSILPETLQNTL